MLIQKIKVAVILIALSFSTMAQSTTYKGMLPCADCEGCIYLLSLDHSGFYKEVMIYNGKNAMPATAAGSFTTKNGFVTLDKKTGVLNYFKQEGNDLLVLDITGQEIKGSLSFMYLLKNETPVSENKTNSGTKVQQNANNERPVSEPNLDGVWIIKSLEGKVITDSKQFMKGLPKLEIDLAKKLFGGNSGCNSFSGKLFLENSKIRFNEMASTEMYCNDNGFEQSYLKALQASTKYTIKNGDLVLSSPDKTILVFTKNTVKTIDTKTTELPNGGMNRLNDNWVLESMGDSKVKAENYMKGLPQLEFHIADMRYMGNTGCNTINGGFEADDKKIKVLPGAMTRMYCEGANEGELLKLLNAANTYSISNNKLVLFENNNAVLVFRKVD